MRLRENDTSRILLADILGHAPPLRLTARSPRRLVALTRHEMEEAGLPAEDTGRLTAAMELGFRASLADHRRPIINSSRVAWDLCRHLAAEQTEVFVALALDIKAVVLEEIIVGSGSMQACVLVPRDVLRAVMAAGGSGFILVHNHPSGDPTPSRNDIQLTEYLQRAGDIVGLPLLDHIVIGADCYTSLRDVGLVNFNATPLLRAAGG